MCASYFMTVCMTRLESILILINICTCVPVPVPVCTGLCLSVCLAYREFRKFPYMSGKLRSVEIDFSLPYFPSAAAAFLAAAAAIHIAILASEAA